MNDFSHIDHRISFHDGCRVDIWSNRNDYYLVEFYEKIGNEWGLIEGNSNFPAFTYFLFYGKRFAIDWQIRISGWEDNKVVPLVTHTFSHFGKDILLFFDSDKFKDHSIWLSLSILMQEKYGCRITIVSRFHDRLNNEFVPVIEKEPEDYTTRFYSSFHIGINPEYSPRTEVSSLSFYPWTLDNPFANSGKSYYSSFHKTHPLTLTPEEIFKDILNL